MQMIARIQIVGISLLSLGVTAYGAENSPLPRPRPRASTDLPLPRGKPLPPPNEVDPFELSDGVSLTPRLGHDDGSLSGLSAVTGKRRAFVPLKSERDVSSPIRHGLSDGGSLGLTFSFETK